MPRKNKPVEETAVSAPAEDPAIIYNPNAEGYDKDVIDPETGLTVGRLHALKALARTEGIDQVDGDVTVFQDGTFAIAVPE